MRFPRSATTLRSRFSRLPRTARRAVVAGAGALTLAALGVGGPLGYVAASSLPRLHTIDDVSAAPVALVLGAGLRGGQPSPALAARLDVAAELFARGTVKVILVSGDNRSHNYNEPDAMAKYLVAKGVPATQIVADYAGRDTYDSCYRARTIFGVTDAIVVSQDFHVPRAVATCESLGVHAQGVGDTTFRHTARSVWTKGVVREVPAAVKMSLDLLSHREPVLGAKESGIDDALAAEPSSS